MFLLALDGYPVHRIRQAFFQYIKDSEDMPTPAAIIKILDAQKISTPEDLSRQYLERRAEDERLALERARDEVKPEWETLSDADKAAFEKRMEDLRAQYKPDGVRHWETPEVHHGRLVDPAEVHRAFVQAWGDLKSRAKEGG